MGFFPPGRGQEVEDIRFPILDEQHRLGGGQSRFDGLQGVDPFLAFLLGGLALSSLRASGGRAQKWR
jgi:hypothetical protein